MPIGEKLANNLMSFRYNEKKKKKDRKMVRVQIPYARVLVVDDVPTNLDVAKGMLKPYNMAVDCVMSGQQAIDLVRKASERYDAIFMDHMMPELDGVEATKIIREKIGTEYAKSVPIIALTANAVQGSEKLFLENGFQAFLPKPIDIEQLDKAVNMWVRDKEKEKALQSVDIARGIKRFSGDEESYRQVLRTYVESTPALIETLRGFGPDELTKAATVFHGIKGSSYAICADFVGKEAEALEYAAKNGDADFVKTNTELFINALKTLVADLGMLLADALHDEVKPVLDEPDKTSLEKLRRACKDYDMDGVDAAMDELEKYRYEKGNELIDWLREEINKAEFEEICESLSA
jgi:CheY-like chemotaxis protein